MTDAFPKRKYNLHHKGRASFKLGIKVDSDLLKGKNDKVFLMSDRNDLFVLFTIIMNHMRVVFTFTPKGFDDEVTKYLGIV